METEGRAFVFIIALAAIISYLIGSFVAVSRFKKWQSELEVEQWKEMIESDKGD